jgi:hypothetical protein
VELFAAGRMKKSGPCPPQALDVLRVLSDKTLGDLLRMSRELPSPIPVTPASVSTVTTMSLWLKSGFALGGE